MEADLKVFVVERAVHGHPARRGDGRAKRVDYRRDKSASSSRLRQRERVQASTHWVHACFSSGVRSFVRQEGWGQPKKS